MSQFWSQIVNKLTPYVPGEQPKVKDLIKLNTNENPYPPSEKVRQVLSAVAQDSLQLYPDPNADDLKQNIADYYQLNKAQVFVGNGSDEVLAHTFVALLKHEQPILFPDLSYSFYPVYCGLFSVDYQTIPVNDDFEIDIEDYKLKNGGIIFPNPNAPTSCFLNLEAIEKLLSFNMDSVVVVDEAYIDFGGDSAAKLIDKYDNLLVIQTFSKSRSLAGLRVGFALGQTHLIEALERVKNSFNSYPLDFFAQKGAIAAINDKQYFQESIDKIIASRGYLTEKLTELEFKVLPSKANFIFVSHQSINAEKLARELRQKNIIVRHFKQDRIENFLRITIGKQNECEQLLSAIKSIISQS
ncbi:MAG: histidinol-phosphate transaminase [Gammaproteobacteria bacterium]|nr:histidinol-phosphate transaminase [Gammaproteobacteria bacterium]